LNGLGRDYLDQVFPIDEPLTGTKPTIPGFTKQTGTTLLLFEIAATKTIKDSVRTIPTERPLTNGLISFITFTLLFIFPNLHIIPQTKNPTNVGLDVVERINLFQ
jgi:hypothetical protein